MRDQSPSCVTISSSSIVTHPLTAATQLNSTQSFVRSARRCLYLPSGQGHTTPSHPEGVRSSSSTLTSVIIQCLFVLTVTVTLAGRYNGSTALMPSVAHCVIVFNQSSA